MRAVLSLRGRSETRVQRTAAVVGIAETSLNDAERALFHQTRPAGFILFQRNCADPDQVIRLVDELKRVADDPNVPILIDQEGGRVARLKPPYWQARPALSPIGELAASDLEAAKEAAWLHARLIAADLAPLGITVNCSPVLDLGLPGQTDAIGDRAFSADPEIVGILGQATVEGYLAGGILPVIKHLPGHGRAHVDSHALLPCVDCGRDLLAECDWRPFRMNAGAPLGMTAHILFSALDGRTCATQSRRIIEEIIRGEIGFEGALFSDDLSMKALGGPLGERAERARQAGCDLALHCNGDLDEMTAVLEASGPLNGESLARVEHALARRRAAEPFDASAGENRLNQLLGPLQDRPEAVA